MSVVVIRTIILYLSIIFALRIMGKRQLGELQPIELVVTLLISNIATLSIEDTNVPLLGCLLPIFTLVVCEVLISFITLKVPLVRRLVSGNPIIIIRDGIIDQKEMRNLRWSIDDLTEQLRGTGNFDVADVAFAVVETSGTLSVYPKYCARPVTPQMLNLPDDGEDMPSVTVVSDGKLIWEGLEYCNLKEEWLDKVLEEKKLDLEDVFLLTCNQRAQYYLAVREGVGE